MSLNKMQLLEKSQALLTLWVNNIFGGEVQNECFSLSFEVEKEAASERIQRYVTSEEYLLRADLEDEEGDSCEEVPIDPEELGVIAMLNAFDRGHMGGINYFLVGRDYCNSVNPQSRLIGCSNLDELMRALCVVYATAWNLFVPYVEGKPAREPDFDKAWKSFLEDFGEEPGRTFKQLGWDYENA